MGKIPLFYKNGLKSVFFVQMFLIIDSLGPRNYPSSNIKDFLKSGHMPFYPWSLHIFSGYLINEILSKRSDITILLIKHQIDRPGIQNSRAMI